VDKNSRVGAVDEETKFIISMLARISKTWTMGYEKDPEGC
jgi:hypothetical protein